MTASLEAAPASVAADPGGPAVVADLLLPGAGQLVRRRWGPALAWIGGFAFACWGTVAVALQLLPHGLQVRLARMEAWSAAVHVLLPIGQVVILLLLGAVPLGVAVACGVFHGGPQQLRGGEWQYPDTRRRAVHAVAIVAAFVASGALSSSLGYGVLVLAQACAVLVAWSALRRRVIAVTLPLGLWAAAWSGAFLATEVEFLLRGGATTVSVPVDRAPDHARSPVLELTGARFARGLVGGFAMHYLHETAGRAETRITFHLLPLVAEDWREEEPVPAWAVVFERGRNSIDTVRSVHDAWGDGSVLGYTLRSPHPLELADALENAAGKGFVSAPGAAVVRLTDDPVRDLSRRAWCAVAFAVVLALLAPAEAGAARILRRYAARADEAAA